MTVYTSKKLRLRKETKYYVLVDDFDDSTEKQISRELYEYLGGS